jgi:hypothetical protein
MTTKLKKLTPGQVKKKIEKNNLTFNKASDAEKRMIVAKEIIQQIKDKRFRAATGNFCSFWHYDSEGKLFDKDKSIQELYLTHRIWECRVCALGALAISITLYKNKETINDYEDDFSDLGRTLKGGDTKNGMLELFGREQIILIEQAFEKGGGYFGSYDYNLDGTVKAVEFRNGIEEGSYNDELVLIKIMENIIKNGGKFIP